MWYHFQVKKIRKEKGRKEGEKVGRQTVRKDFTSRIGPPSLGFHVVIYLFVSSHFAEASAVTNVYVC